MDWTFLSSPAVIAPAVVAAVVSGVVALTGSLLTVAAGERRLRREFRLDVAAESAARKFLGYRGYPSRSFHFLGHRLKGFNEDELRKILVRAGAVRFTGDAGEERWGLRERNRHLIRRTPKEEADLGPSGTNRTPE